MAEHHEPKLWHSRLRRATLGRWTQLTERERAARENILLHSDVLKAAFPRRAEDEGSSATKVTQYDVKTREEGALDAMRQDAAHAKNEAARAKRYFHDLNEQRKQLGETEKALARQLKDGERTLATKRDELDRMESENASDAVHLELQMSLTQERTRESHPRPARVSPPTPRSRVSLPP